MGAIGAHVTMGEEFHGRYVGTIGRVLCALPNSLKLRRARIAPLYRHGSLDSLIGAKEFTGIYLISGPPQVPLSTFGIFQLSRGRKGTTRNRFFFWATQL